MLSRSHYLSSGGWFEPRREEALSRPRAEREESRRGGGSVRREARGAARGRRGGAFRRSRPALTKITLCNKNDSKFPAADGGSDGGALDNGASLSPLGRPLALSRRPATPIFRFKVPPCAPERNLANFYYLRLILQRRRVSHFDPPRLPRASPAAPRTSYRPSGTLLRAARRHRGSAPFFASFHRQLRFLFALR